MGLSKVAERIRNRFRRKPDFVIGGEDDPYMLRWYVIPRNRWFNIYLHKFLRDDDDRALHDHPWVSLSFALSGEYIEHTARYTKRRGRGSVVFRTATHAHRIELVRKDGEPVPAWTLFLTGPKVREWGFHCPRRWVPWHEFVSETDAGNTGKGCGE
jgi:hypothetical protein